MAKALVLVSDGLDGVLAARLLEDQGVEVEPVHFRTGFARGAPRGGSGSEVSVVDVFREYLERVVLRPKHGFGRAMNPCIDCRTFFARKAEEMRASRGASLVATGEVLGQDRFGQRRDSLERVESESGAKLLRPLSARHLPPTEAERDGTIDRSRLGGVHGSSRAGQRDLARRFGIEEAPHPSGGCCRLADPAFARRLRDLLAHADPAEITERDIRLLGIGRHFRLAHDLKAIFGRDERESEVLEREAGDRLTVQVGSGRGSLGVAEGRAPFEKVETLAGLAVRYSRHRADASVEVVARRGAEERCLRASALACSESLLL